MKREALNPTIKKMKLKLANNADALFLLNIIESFIDHHEEEFRDLKDDLESYLNQD